MTAEIAILNRSALALAADSAVTISVAGKTKVYDTAEKLFELSKRQPVALMIYNNVEFVGVPLDVLIRRFRNEQDGKGVLYAKIEDACNQFLDYLKTFNHDVLEEKKYLYSVLRDAFAQLNKAVRDETLRDIETWIANPETERVKPSDILDRHLDAAIKREQGRPLKGFLSKVKISSFRSAYSDVIDSVIGESFDIEIDGNTKNKLARLAFAILKSSRRSDLRTGLVFGGFAEQDMFPTLRYLEVDGIFLGELKILSCSEIDIDRKKTRAEVVPFAQKEMVERFMFGLDSSLEADIGTFVKDVVNGVVDITGNPVEEAVAAEIKARVSDRFDTLLGKLKSDSRQDLLDIVYFMSKKELADIAHALVELTSHKRRFSTDEQTVGGPIDVAILTKNEGFIWIQRKHYFSSDINRGYTVRTRAI
jgi:hypothetical protein